VGEARREPVRVREYVYRLLLVVYFTAAVVLGIIISADVVRSVLP